MNTSTPQRLNRIPRVIPTQRPLWRRFGHWLTCRRLQRRQAGLVKEITTLVTWMSEDEAVARQHAIKGTRSPVLRHRMDEERKLLAALQAELHATTDHLEALQ